MIRHTDEKNNIMRNADWLSIEMTPLHYRNLYHAGSCGEKLKGMNQLLRYFPRQSDKLLGAFLTQIFLSTLAI